MYNSISAAVLSLVVALLTIEIETLHRCGMLQPLSDKHWSATDCTGLSYGCIHCTVYNRMQRTACLQGLTG